MGTGVSAQTVVLDALRIAAEQTYFWTPEWQAKEQAADQAIAEGRVQTFDKMDQMLDFLDALKYRATEPFWEAYLQLPPTIKQKAPIFPTLPAGR